MYLFLFGISLGFPMGAALVLLWAIAEIGAEPRDARWGTWSRRGSGVSENESQTG